jgi:hypothetical protein
MKKLIVALCALALTACTPVLAGLATMAGAPASPAAIADKTVLDEKAGIAVETMYAAVARAGALAFRAGLIKPSVDPEVQRDDVCALVAAKSYEPTDRGGELVALECKLRAARDLTRRAYDTGNAATYDVAARDAIALGREMLAHMKGN